MSKEIILGLDFPLKSQIDPWIVFLLQYKWKSGWKCFCWFWRILTPEFLV